MPATLANALRLRGWSVTEEYLSEQLETTPNGTYWINLGEYLYKLRLWTGTTSAKDDTIFFCNVAGAITAGFAVFLCLPQHTMLAAAVCNGVGLVVYDTARDSGVKIARDGYQLRELMQINRGPLRAVVAHLPVAPEVGRSWSLYTPAG